MHLRGLVSLAMCVAALGAARDARAQACCATTSTIFPARLQDSEQALIGLAASVSGAYGSFDGGRVLRGQPAGVGEVDLLQTLLVTTRVIEPLQVNVSLPFAETWRTAQGVSDLGGGVGDMSVALRWDMFRAGMDRVVPGIAATASVTLPTGTAPELARDPLAADATGLGSAQLATGLAFEQVFGRVLFALAGSVVFHGARTVGGVHSQLGPDLWATLGASYTFPSGLAVGGALTYMGSFDSNLSGEDVPGSARAMTQLAITAALPIRTLTSRVLASLFFVPPISSVGQNELATVGGSLTFIYGFARLASCRCPGGVCPPAR